MNKLTPITQTLQQRRALAHYVPMAAQAQAERIMRDERDRQAGAEILARIRLHDLSGYAPAEPEPVSVLRERVLDLAIGLCVVGIMLGVGMLLREPVRAVLAWLGVMS